MRTLVSFSLFALTADAAEYSHAKASADSGGKLLVCWRETGLSPQQ